MILATEDMLGAEDMPLDLIDETTQVSAPGYFKLTRKGIHLESLEKDLVCQALRLTHGNQTQAGRLLGLNRDQVRYRIEKFQLTVPENGDGTGHDGAEA
jgi:transcriptional regulator with GAF, ATPase, and Fis domain